MRAAASPHQKSKAALLLLASAAFAALLLSPTTVRAQGFPGGVSLASAPDRCISVGSRFFSACNDDITRLAAALGVNLSLDDPDLSRKVCARTGGLRATRQLLLRTCALAPRPLPPSPAAATAH